MEALSDNALARAVAGDRDALVDLLRRHTPTIRRKLQGKIPKRWQSELSVDDVLQETCANAVTGIGRFVSGSEAAFRKWLTTIAERNLIDALRGLEPGSNDSHDQNRRKEELPHDGPTDPRTRPSQHVARLERGTALDRAIDQLPEVYAQAVRMYYLEGQAIEDVAAELERSNGAVYMLLARARDRLHELMGPTSRFFTK